MHYEETTCFGCVYERPEDHTETCQRRRWHVVRVWFEATDGTTHHTDSIRLNASEAIRLAASYKATGYRVQMIKIITARYVTKAARAQLHRAARHAG